MFYVPLAAVEEEGRDGGEDDRPRDEDGATATGVAEQPPVTLRVAKENSLADNVVKGVVCLKKCHPCKDLRKIKYIFPSQISTLLR